MSKETEINVTEIEVNKIIYVRKDSIKEQQIEGDIKIVILQRGWNMVGKFVREGNDCKLYNASVIRRWGTTKGLGELAENGITKDTILDVCYNVVEFDYLTVIATISCNSNKWK